MRFPNFSPIWPSYHGLTFPGCSALLALLNSTVETTTIQGAAFTNVNATLNATASATPLPMPSDFSSLVTFIYSFSALR
ncbi:hypothetical protein BJV78DRAFT_1174708, partial [Lactifluus subvellereus]